MLKPVYRRYFRAEPRVARSIIMNDAIDHGGISAPRLIDGRMGCQVDGEKDEPIVINQPWN